MDLKVLQEKRASLMLIGKSVAIQIQNEFEIGRIGNIRDYMQQFKELESKIKYIDYLIKEARKEAVIEADAYKKKFKHEFLTQIKCFPGTIDEIVAGTLEAVPNPGINIPNYISYLMTAGYFIFGNELDSSALQLTDKAERYLENEANISLKK